MNRAALRGWLLLSLWAAPASAKTLTVCDDVQEPATLDPHKEFSEKNHTLVQQIFEGLVRLGPEGRIEPALAVSWERKDPLRMRFKLRPGVRFHDGEPFDAEAVRFSITRYLDPKTGFPAAGFIAPLDKAEVVDPMTVDIVTKFPDGLLLNRLAGFILIVAPGPVRRDGDGAHHEHPVGTGAFRFDAWDRGREVRLRANGDYWMKGYPKIDRLAFRFIPTEKQLEALKSGEIDILTELPGTQTAAAIGAGRIEVIKSPGFYATIGSFNVGRAPLKDRRVREALNLAVNRDDLIKFDLMGNGRQLATVTMAGEEGHNAALKPFPHDPQRARRLLREAGYPDGFKLKVAAKYQGERPAKIIADQLGRIGVKLDLRLFTDAELMPMLAKEDWDMFLAGCPDPMAHSFFIQSIFVYSKSPYRVGKDPEYDSRLEAMVSTLDDVKRRGMAEDLGSYMREQALGLFLYQRIKTYGARKGVTHTPWITGMPYFYAVDKREETP